eukprot:5143938-Pyramimonas_sp.AAC.2
MGTTLSKNANVGYPEYYLLLYPTSIFPLITGGGSGASAPPLPARTVPPHRRESLAPVAPPRIA